MTSSEILMTVFTAVIATTGVIGAIIFNNQLSVMQGQLNEMKSTGTQNITLIETNKKLAAAAQEAADVAQKTLIAGQRAWIKISEVKLTEPLSFTSSGWGARTAVSLLLTNIGNAPALLVKQHAWLSIVKTGPSTRIEPLDEQMQRCEGIKGEPFRELNAPILFPEESLPGVNSNALSIVIGVPRDEIDAALEGKPSASIPFAIMGCVDYSFPTDPGSHHQTRFLFSLLKKQPVTISDGFVKGNPIRPEDGMIKAEDLMFLNLGFGHSAD